MKKAPKQKLVCARIFPNRSDAEVARALLEKYRVSSLIEAQDLGSMRPHLAIGAQAQLMVNKNDSKKAKSILKKR